MSTPQLRVFCAFLAIVSFTSIAQQPIGVQLGGQLMVDYDHFDANFVDVANAANSHLELRRVRLALASQLSKSLSANYSVELTQDLDVKAAFIKYTGWDIANITIGRQKEGFGFERLMGARNFIMIERAMATTVISPGLSYGVNFAGSRGELSWQLGYFQKNDADNGESVTGRLAWTPWHTDNGLIHVGIASSQRRMHGDTYSINRKVEVGSADPIIKSRKIVADSVSQTGFEFMWQNNGFLNITEWQTSTVSAVDGSEYLYQGGYSLMAYSLSGKNRKFEEGILGGIDSSHWEVTMRYSQMALVEENDQVNTISIGLNYVVKNDLKFMVNFIKARISEDGAQRKSGEAISLRVQYHF